MERTIKVMLDAGAVMPTRAHEWDAGLDLYAMEDITIVAHRFGGQGVVVDTGVHIEIPEGSVGFVHGRSGLNIMYGVVCPTGTIDCGYTGSIKVKLYNFGGADYNVNKGDRIAQLVIQPVKIWGPVRVESLGTTERGADGFGSSGK